MQISMILRPGAAGLLCAVATVLAFAPQISPGMAQERLPWSNDPRPPAPYEERRELPPPAPYGNQPTYQSQPAPYGYPPQVDARGQRDDAYRPPVRNEPYPPQPYGREPVPYGSEPPLPNGPGGYGNPGYGQPYEAAPTYRPEYRDANSIPPRRFDEPSRDGTFSMHEISNAGHGFFGSISQGLASVIEHAFKKQGRPNGYILGEDVGGAFVAGLRYGEGTLYTKDAGNHKVYWQGPSIGYDAGAEGSKVMVLVYNLRDPAEIYRRFGGIAGSAYVIGGVGLTFQSNNDVVLAPIRAGIGLRLGANIGYLKYSRRPTWNPF